MISRSSSSVVSRIDGSSEIQGTDTAALPSDLNNDDGTKTLIIGIVVALVVVIMVVVAFVTYRVVSRKILRQSSIQTPVIAPGLDADKQNTISHEGTATGLYGKLPVLDDTVDARSHGYTIATLATDADYGQVPRESARAREAAGTPAMSLKSMPPEYESVRIAQSEYDIATSPMHL